MMLRKRATTQTYSRPHLSKKSRKEEEDMITQLPEDVRRHILSFLSTKHAVSTTILSRSWKNLWTLASTKNLELDDSILLHPESNSETIHHHPSLFSDFVNRVLGLISVPCIQTLKLCCSYPYDPDHINCWLHTACKYNVSEVNIRVYGQNPIKLPSNLYGSTWLVVLKLNANVSLDFRDSISFPRLKVLWIKVYDTNDVNLTQKLFRDHICPILEELFIEGEILDENSRVVLLVILSSLKRLKIEYRLAHSFQGGIEYNFVLHCPNLECLDLRDDFLAKYSARDLKVLDYAKISIGYPCADYAAFDLYGDVNPSNRAFEVLKELSNVKSLSLSGGTTKALSCSYETAQHTGLDDDDEDALLIRLRNFELYFRFLTFLELGFRTCESWSLLPLLLHSSPNVEYLILKKELDLTSCRYKTVFFWRPEGPVPECMSLHLREIEIWGFQGESQELATVEFFLGHAEVLQKMTIHVQEASPNMMFSEHVLQIPRVSEACEVEIISTKSCIQ
ncbi:F-box/LRR-repeat protein At4g14103-like [Rosa rugosa]|uniref:F-box/LRR-repeat protein At4g14103-like n=1 Tax=Rosa rugosa TaxID=74645 RepID=UPI002B40CE8B|nr:F-box/LRR-repeat protein At4g14103-like [Rosa rugosa]